MFSRKKFLKMINFFFGQNKQSVNITKEIHTHTQGKTYIQYIKYSIRNNVALFLMGDFLRLGPIGPRKIFWLVL